MTLTTRLGRQAVRTEPDETAAKAIERARIVAGDITEPLELLRHSDLNLIKRAVKSRWKTPPETQRRIIAQIVATLDAAELNEDFRSVTLCGLTLAEMSKAGLLNERTAANVE